MLKAMNTFSDALSPVFYALALMGIDLFEIHQTHFAVRVVRFFYIAVELSFLFYATYCNCQLFAEYYISRYTDEVTLYYPKWYYFSVIIMALAHVLTKIVLHVKYDDVKEFFLELHQLPCDKITLQRANLECKNQIRSVFIVAILLGLVYRQSFFNLSVEIFSYFDGGHSLLNWMFIAFFFIVNIPLTMVIQILMPEKMLLILVAIMNSIIQSIVEHWVSRIQAEPSYVKKLQLLHTMCNAEIKLEHLYYKLRKVFSFLLLINCFLIIRGVPILIADRVVTCDLNNQPLWICTTVGTMVFAAWSTFV